ncbi:MAG: hypothetical protein HY683_05930 [Chloroflexi bacterium]|nr:hypothetical protein [Chloroflexota bacterium]
MNTVACLVCGGPLTVRMARGRKSGKPFLMLVCSRDGRHFRGFVSDQRYVKQVLARVSGSEGRAQGSAASPGVGSRGG